MTNNWTYEHEWNDLQNAENQTKCLHCFHSKKLHTEISGLINKSLIDYVHVIGTHVKETYKNINKDKKGQILKKKIQIIDLIKNKLNNNDYLMIKGSNSTGLHKLVVAIKTGRANAL